MKLMHVSPKGLLFRWPLVVALIVLSTALLLASGSVNPVYAASTGGGCTNDAFFNACISVDSSGTMINASSTTNIWVCGTSVYLWEDGDLVGSYSIGLECRAPGTILSVPAVPLAAGHTWQVEVYGSSASGWSPYFGNYHDVWSPVLYT